MKMSTASARAAVMMVTAASQEQAALIAHTLVGERLAACVNLVSPIRSIYRWNDEVHDDPEHLMIINTRANLFQKVEARIREMHSYEVPEVISVSIASGSKPYLNWIFDSTRMPQPSRAKAKRGR